MTPDIKAKYLLDKMSSQTYDYQPYAGATPLTEEVGWEAGKKCALILVEEVLKDLKESAEIAEQSDLHPHARGLIMGGMVSWNSVKEELLKL